MLRCLQYFQAHDRQFRHIDEACKSCDHRLNLAEFKKSCDVLGIPLGASLEREFGSMARPEQNPRRALCGVHS